MILVYDVTLKDDEGHETNFKVYQPDNESYSGWEMLVDDERMIPVEHVDRYRDGGTTVMNTQFGTLTVPQTMRRVPFYGNEPSWHPAKPNQ